MSKLNVNVATREELAEVAGLRPELAEAIGTLRDERGKLSNIEELDEVQGVGPATLEQLRQALTFGPTAEEKAERERIEAAQEGERERAKAAQEGERVARESAKKTAEVTASAMRSSAEAGHDAAQAGAQAASNAARTGLQLAQRTAGNTARVQRETMRNSAEGTVELGKLYTDLLKAQTEHGVQVVAAFGKVFNWNEAVQVQSDFMRASFERMTQINSRYIEIVQAVMTSAVSDAKHQAEKAA